MWCVTTFVFWARPNIEARSYFWSAWGHDEGQVYSVKLLVWGPAEESWSPVFYPLCAEFNQINKQFSLLPCDPEYPP